MLEDDFYDDDDYIPDFLDDGDNSTDIDSFRGVDSSFEGLPISFGINATIALFCFLTFSLLRARRCCVFRHFFSPLNAPISFLQDHLGVGQNPDSIEREKTKKKRERHHSLPLIPPPDKELEFEKLKQQYIEGLDYKDYKLPFYRGFFSWIWPVLGYTEDRMLKDRGEDACLYFRFLRLCLVLCFGIGIGAIILIPINASGGNSELDVTDPDRVTDMGILTLGNIPSSDPKYLAHVIFTFIYSLFAYFLVYYGYARYHTDRINFFKKNEPRNYTVMAHSIPKEMRNRNILRNWFENNFHFNVIDVQIVYHAKELEKLQQKRRNYINILERAQTRFKKDGIQRNIKIGKFSFIPFLNHETVPKIPYYKKKIVSIEKKIEAWQQESDVLLDPTGVAFIVFDSMIPSHMSAVTALSDPESLVLTPAPDSKAIYWENLSVSSFGFGVRFCLLILIIAIVTMFFIIPVIFVTGMANVRNLAKVDALKWLVFVEDLNSSLVGIIEGFLPTLILSVCIAIIPTVFRFIVEHIGSFYRRYEKEWLVMRCWCIFLLFNVLFLLTIGGAVFRVLQLIINKPSDIVNLLANSLPQQSIFFINFILVSGLGRVPLKLFRLADLVKQYLLYALRAIRRRTKKELREALKPVRFDYANQVGYDLLIFTIVLTYSTMAPLVSIFGLLYFSLVYLVHRYNIIYANWPLWESGGSLSPHIFHQQMLGILIFQLTMTGVFASSLFGGGGVTVILPIITVGLWIYAYHKWKRIGNYGCIDGLHKIPLPPISMLQGEYAQPSLKPLSNYVFKDEMFPHDGHLSTSVNPDFTVHQDIEYLEENEFPLNEIQNDQDQSIVY